MSAASSRSTPSRCARASRAISTRSISTTARWSSRAICCSPSTSGRSRTRSSRRKATSRRRKANLAFAEADLERGQAARARPHHHRADLRPAHPGEARRARLRSRRKRPRCARPSSISSSPSCARRSPAASATAACRPAISSPAAPAAPRRCSPPSSRSIRSASSSPWMRPRTCATSASPAAARTSTGRDGGVIGRAQAARREGLRPSRQDGFRRQRDRPLVGHDPRPRGVRQSRRRVHARHVRPHPRAGLAALRRAAGAGCRDRHRAGAQVRAAWSTTTTSRGRNTSRSGQLVDGLARHQGRASTPTTASSSTA